jgi:hypothetical protein
MLGVVLTAAGCGGSASGTPATSTVSVETSLSTTTTAPPPPAPVTTGSTAGSPVTSDSGDKQAVQAYFAAMAPALDKDYEGLQWFRRSMDEWAQTYGSAGPSKEAWKAFRSIIEEAIPKQQEIIQDYEAITAPEAFQVAHTTLLENNRNGMEWGKKLAMAIRTNRPDDEVLSMIMAGPPEPSNLDVLAKFRFAAAQSGIELPGRLIDTYSDPGQPGEAEA